MFLSNHETQSLPGLFSYFVKRNAWKRKITLSRHFQHLRDLLPGNYISETILDGRWWLQQSKWDPRSLWFTATQPICFQRNWEEHSIFPRYLDLFNWVSIFSAVGYKQMTLIKKTIFRHIPIAQVTTNKTLIKEFYNTQVDLWHGSHPDVNNHNKL